MAISLHVRPRCGGKWKKQPEMSRIPLAARAKEKKRCSMTASVSRDLTRVCSLNHGDFDNQSTTVVAGRAVVVGGVVGSASSSSLALLCTVMDEVTTQNIGEIIVCMVTLMVAIHNCLMREALSIGLRRNRLPSRSYNLDFHNKRAHLRNLVYSNDNNCYNVLRMYRATFDRLCSMLDEIGGLKSTKHMLVDEQVAMCLNVLAHHAKNRVIQWNFGRSGSTISKYFNAVLKAIIQLHRVLYKTPNPVPEDSTDPRWKLFKNCLGALDGIHIKIRVHKNDQTRFRNRKGDVTVNILGVCSQDEQFIYVLSGWEGSAADGRVLKSALNRPRGFKVPADRYYLVDAGYNNAEGFLAPYRGERYHLNEWREGRHPTTPRECFNMRHSAARNVIERCFRMLKNWWAILRSPSFYPVKTHNMIIIACCNNMIRRDNAGDPLNDEAENLVLEPAEEPVEEPAEVTAQ
ncbi:protein ALP1-like [Senna tora]|uniref:Protein ALP1-like n=1 Tax=Senna tora TaxID=362788 RepID=A0A835CHI9_9FABA|nr:protein ALP1-like [Senna tora]